MASEEVKAFAKAIGEELGDKGRVLLRASGTEPKIRIMAECEDAALAHSIAQRMQDFIESKIKGIKNGTI